jgi:hypothetical protein
MNKPSISLLSNFSLDLASPFLLQKGAGSQPSLARLVAYHTLALTIHLQFFLDCSSADSELVYRCERRLWRQRGGIPSFILAHFYDIDTKATFLTLQRQFAEGAHFLVLMMAEFAATVARLHLFCFIYLYYILKGDHLQALDGVGMEARGRIYAPFSISTQHWVCSKLGCTLELSWHRFVEPDFNSLALCFKVATVLDIRTLLHGLLSPPSPSSSTNR